ncbi:DUF1398 family protein [Streptococcus halichoeri]|uniref:DUF1398 family protein n=1 Tax=Streptococcus halichoeri TaxID=254785 RepID=UPI001E5D2E32|nr:DUF1398 family protein [Streptococcus halichoeri]
MLNKADIQAAHQQFTGPDFPKLIQAFKAMGMLRYTVFIDRGEVSYQSADQVLITNGYQVRSEIAARSNLAAAQADLARHQAGQSNFEAFCQDMAAAGIYKWVSDLQAMTCSYYDQSETALIVEQIPQ